MDSNAELGVCGGLYPNGEPYRVCGSCSDGDVCVWQFGVLLPICVSESLARIAWRNGFGSAFTYADGSPYDGRPIPSADACPPPDGDLELCGGECGGCSRPGFSCTGRSPTHPLGICTNEEAAYCDAVPDGQRLSINTAAGSRGIPVTVCVRDCERLAATVPGGAKCMAP
jgi:hypothetical protein